MNPRGASPRDVIVATEAVRSLSVRNALAGTITTIVPDEPDADLVSIDVGGVTILARITSAATRALNLRPGMRAWALVKTVSLNGRSLGTAARTGPAPSADAGP